MKRPISYRWLAVSYALCLLGLAAVWGSHYDFGLSKIVMALMATSAACALVALFKTGRSRPPQGLASDQSGSVALTTGLVLLVLVIMAGFSLDFIMASRTRSTLQEALDSATLSAAQEKTDVDIKARGAKVFAAHMVDNQRLVSPTANFVPTADAVTADADATYSPLFLNMAKGPIAIHAHTQVKRAINPLELALVLDTTFSMSANGKITTLKTAATNLVTKLTAVPSADVKIAVVPFAQYVNVGVSRRNQPWITVPADYSTPQACYQQTSTSTCTSYSCTKTADGVTYQATCSSCSSTLLATPKTICPSPQNHVFYGCVGSPAYPKNVQDSDPLRVYPGYLDLTCSKELTPLTSTVATVKAAITALSASGETYIPSGLAWGFNVLSMPQPFTEAKAYDSANRRPRKALVLMTDGENTKAMKAADGTHNLAATGAYATQPNTYTAELCANIKAQKIELFTVAFSVTDTTAKTMLQTCATDSAHYFDASDSAALLKAFDDIAGALRDLYVSQ